MRIVALVLCKVQRSVDGDGVVVVVAVADAVDVVDVDDNASDPSIEPFPLTTHTLTRHRSQRTTSTQSC